MPSRSSRNPHPHQHRRFASRSAAAAAGSSNGGPLRPGPIPASGPTAVLAAASSLDPTTARENFDRVITNGIGDRPHQHTIESLIGETRSALALQHFQQSDTLSLEAAHHAKMGLKVLQEGLDQETLKRLKPAIKASRDFLSWRFAGLKLGFGTDKARKLFFHRSYADSANEYDECQGLMLSCQKILQSLMPQDDTSNSGRAESGRANHSADRGAGAPSQNRSPETETRPNVAADVLAASATSDASLDRAESEQKARACEKDERELEDDGWRRGWPAAPSEGAKTREHWPEFQYSNAYQSAQHQQYNYQYPPIINTECQSYQHYGGQQHSYQSNQVPYAGQQVWQQSSPWQAAPQEFLHWQHSQDVQGSPPAPTDAEINSAVAPSDMGAENNVAWPAITAPDEAQPQTAPNRSQACTVPSILMAAMIRELPEMLRTVLRSPGSAEDLLTYLCAQPLEQQQKDQCVNVLTSAAWVHGNDEAFLTQVTKALCNLRGPGFLLIFLKRGQGMGSWSLQHQASALRPELLLPALASTLARWLEVGGSPNAEMTSQCLGEALCSIVNLLKLVPSLAKLAVTSSSRDCFAALLALKDSDAVEQQVLDWLHEHMLAGNSSIELQSEVWKLLAVVCRQRGLIFGASICIEGSGLEQRPRLHMEKELERRLKTQAQQIVMGCADQSALSQEHFSQLLQLLVHLEPFKDVLQRVWHWRPEDTGAKVAVTRDVIDEVWSTTVLEIVVSQWVISVWSESPDHGQDLTDQHQSLAEMMNSIQRHGNIGAHLADAWAMGANVRLQLLEEMTEKWRSGKVIGCLERVGLSFGINDDPSWQEVEKASGDPEKVYFHRSLILLHDLKAFNQPISHKIWELLLLKLKLPNPGKDLRARVENMRKFADVLPDAMSHQAADLLTKILIETKFEAFHTSREFKNFQLEALSALQSTFNAGQLQPSDACREKFRELSSYHHVSAKVHTLAQKMLSGIMN